MNVKVSVIVPVYKAENYIARCARSLFGQTLEALEYIFVDDSSPDNSIAILENILNEYPNRKAFVSIVRHKENKGVSISRQDGVKQAKGEYVIHCDPDDWADPDMYRCLYEHAVENQSDVVMCDWFQEYNDHSDIKCLNLKCLVPSCLLEKMVSGSLHGGLCNKLVKKEFIEKHYIKFIPNIPIYEDLLYNLEILKFSPAISYINKPLYHYDKFSNASSLTSKRSIYTKEQHDLIYSSFSNLFDDKHNVIYKTAITFIAYWAFAYNVLTQKEYTKCYRKHLRDFINSHRNKITKIVVILSLFNFKAILYLAYRGSIRLK